MHALEEATLITMIAAWLLVTFTAPVAPTAAPTVVPTWSFTQQYIGDLFVMSDCYHDCNVTVMRPVGRGVCEFVTLFEVSRDELPKFLAIDPMETCGRCTLRSRCAHMKLYLKQQTAVDGLIAVLMRKGFYQVYGSDNIHWFVNRTATVMVYPLDSSIGFKFPKYCVEAKYEDAAALIEKTIW